MKMTFDDFLLKENPELNEAQTTSLKRFYVSKLVQGHLSKVLGFPAHLRSPIEISVSVAEDLLESFFGALMTVGDTVFRQGMGYGLAYSFTQYIYTNLEPIDISKGIDPNITLVKNIYNKLDWGDNPKDFEEITQVGDVYTITLKWPPRAREFLRSRQIFTDVLASYTSKREGSRKAAESQAYEMAIKKLYEIGITMEYAMAEKERKRKTGQFQFSELYRQALEKAAPEGYRSFEFVFPIPGRTTRFVQLQGEKADGELVSLVTLPIDPTKIPDKPEKPFKNYWSTYVLAYYLEYGRQEYPQ